MLLIAPPVSALLPLERTGRDRQRGVARRSPRRSWLRCCLEGAGHDLQQATVACPIAPPAFVLPEPPAALLPLNVLAVTVSVPSELSMAPPPFPALLLLKVLAVIMVVPQLAADRPAYERSAVAAEGASRDRQEATVVEDRPAKVSGTVAAEGACRDRQQATVVEDRPTLLEFPFCSVSATRFNVLPLFT